MPMIGREEISLYFHIPFCTKKCGYCHFYVLPDKEIFKADLLEGFLLEWSRWLPYLQNKSVATIYFGGGTPFLFGPERINKVLNQIKKDLPFVPYNSEITLEANPENVNLEEMHAYREAGINRVSLGIQTLDDALLKLLGRLHSAEKALEAVYTTLEAGISNISIDLMYDLPQQKKEHWDHTLQRIQNLPITHLSLYNLTIEPHTQFFKKSVEITKQLPDEETSLYMYEEAIKVLDGCGLKQYEISAFARENNYSKHNAGYWTARPFLGFGPSAFSYWEGKRFRNVANLNRYVESLRNGESPIDFEEKLDPEAHIRELFVIQLRLRQGVNLKEFEERHGTLPVPLKRELRRLEKENFLKFEEGLFTLTHQGLLFYEQVAIDLI